MYTQQQMNSYVIYDIDSYKKPDANDILQMHRLIYDSKKTSAAVKKVESDILINSYHKNKLLFSNRLIYWRLGSVIHSFSELINDPVRIQHLASNLHTIIMIIFSKNLTPEMEMEVINKICLLHDSFYNKYSNKDKKNNDIQNIYSDLTNLYFDIVGYVIEINSVELEKFLTIGSYEENKKIS